MSDSNKTYNEPEEQTQACGPGFSVVRVRSRIGSGVSDLGPGLILGLKSGLGSWIWFWIGSGVLVLVWGLCSGLGVLILVQGHCSGVGSCSGLGSWFGCGWVAAAETVWFLVFGTHVFEDPCLFHVFLLHCLWQ